MAELERPPKTRWTSFVADPTEPRPRVLYQEDNPAHRARVEHNRHTILLHLGGEDGRGWTVIAIDRATRQWAVSQDSRQLTAAEQAFELLYGPAPGE